MCDVRRADESRVIMRSAAMICLQHRRKYLHMSKWFIPIKGLVCVCVCHDWTTLFTVV